MNARERVLTALNHREPDRIPLNYHADTNMSVEMKKHFCIEGNESRNCWLTGNEDLRLLAALDCDLRTLVPDYVGPAIQMDTEGAMISMFGEHLLIQENIDGTAHFIYRHLPLAHADTLEAIDKHPWPKADWFDFSSIREQVAQYEGYAIIGGDMGTLDCMNRGLMLFGYERVMMGMMERDPVILRAFQHIADFYYEYLKRLLEAAEGKIDIVYFGEDLGTQGGPRINPALYRDVIQPIWKPHMELVKSHGCFVMQHSCGFTRAFYPDMINLGINIHDTVQTETADMDPVALKRDFGDRMCFHGGISIQQVLQTGTVEDVAAEVIRMIQALGRNGGYILAPTHWIQSGTPIQNVLTMYEVAKEFSTEFYRKGK